MAARLNADGKPRRKQTAAQLANLTGGSRKGKPSKVTAALKDMIIGALNQVGGQDYLARQAILNPGPFMTLVGKVLPLQLTGNDGGAITLNLTHIDAAL